MTTTINITPASAESLSEASAQPRLPLLLARWHAERDKIDRLMIEHGRAAKPRQFEIEEDVCACFERMRELDPDIIAARGTDLAALADKLQIAVGDAESQLTLGDELPTEWLMTKAVQADLRRLAAPRPA